MSLTSEQKKDLAAWLIEMTSSPYWQMLQKEMQERVDALSHSVINNKEENKWDRGMLAGFAASMRYPSEFIKTVGTVQDTSDT